MTAGRLNRALCRIVLLLTTITLTVGVSHGAWAAPSSQAEAAVEEIQRQVSQIRGLSPKTTTPVVTLPRPALVERLSRAINTDPSIREFLTSQMLLEVLGAMQRGFDLRDLQLRLLSEQTVAVYDFDSQSIFLVADYGAGGDLGADARLVVAHELTHALQDQHFNLKRVLPTDAENSDAATAARALVEGDAMLTMRIWGRQFLRPNEKRALGDDPMTADPVLDSAPPLVRGELLFPYDAGWVFAQLLFQDGGFAALDQAFARPPRSTEQILHPEKYAANENPVSVELPSMARSLGGSWVTRRTDVFGELILRLLLEPNVGWPTAEAAAAGWGGDAYTILEDDAGRRIVGMVTVWDTEGDAAEMYNAFVLSVTAQYADDQVRTITQPSMARWVVPGYQVQALKTDNVVRIAYAPDLPALERVDTLLAGAEIGPSGPVVPLPAAPGAPGTAPEPIGTPGEGFPPPPPPPSPGAEPGRFSTPTVPAPSGTPESAPTDDEDEDAPGAPGAPGQNVSPGQTLPPVPTLPRETPDPADEAPLDDED